MQSKSDNIVILGAGLTGLSLAYHMHRGYVIYEKEENPGGMARTIICKPGYRFDYDGHLLHFRSEYTYTLVKKLIDGNLAPHKRNSWVFLKGCYARYPFQANFYGLPSGIVKDCLLGIIKARLDRLRPGQSSNGNFENWTYRTFGNGVARHFMIPYNRKFWTISPSSLTCDWLERFVPVPTLEETVAGAVSNNPRQYGYNARFWYPVKGGISQLVNGFSENIKDLYCCKKAVVVDQFRREIVFEDGGIRRFRRLVSTVPLPELSRMLVKVPQAVRSAFARLRYTSILVFNIGIKKEEVTDKHWVYFPDPGLVFYRIGFPTNFSADVAPEGRTSMYVEISLPGGKDIDIEGYFKNVKEGLRMLGIIDSEEDIEIFVPLCIKYGYAIYDHNRSESLAIIQEYLRRFNIYIAGRYGSWAYMSMEDAILQGRMMAEKLKVS